MKFFGNLAVMDSPQQICEHYPAFLQKVFDMAEGHETTMIGVAVDTLGIMGSTVEGKQVLQKTGVWPYLSLNKLKTWLSGCVLFILREIQLNLRNCPLYCSNVYPKVFFYVTSYVLPCNSWTVFSHHYVLVSQTIVSRHFYRSFVPLFCGYIVWASFCTSYNLSKEVLEDLPLLYPYNNSRYDRN